MIYALRRTAHIACIRQLSIRFKRYQILMVDGILAYHITQILKMEILQITSANILSVMLEREEVLTARSRH